MNEELQFYQDLVAFKDFSELSTHEYFHQVPPSWYVVITDVRGSTKAINEGRYKQVNLIGASCIASVLGVIQAYEFPFVFGGDGATMLIPEKYLKEVGENLQALQALSANDFNLELRVGCMALRDLYDQGQTLSVGKYELSPGNCLAQFKGTALNYAETCIKTNAQGATILQPIKSQTPNIQGLSCRISPFKSKHGVILSLLCRPEDSNAKSAEETSNEVLKEVLKDLRKILNNDFQSASPVSQKSLHWSFIPKTLKEEIKLSYDGKKPYAVYFVLKALAILINNMLLIFNYSIGAFNPKKYKSELVLNSDFKKFDGTLRMVIDCNFEQADKIAQLMENLYAAKKIFYGIHKSKEALMTCLVQSASSNQHTHFIDGADGGYAIAAVMFKKQLKEAEGYP